MPCFHAHSKAKRMNGLRLFHLRWTLRTRVVEPAERTFASGVTNLVRLAAWTVAPAFAGLLMVGDSMHRPLVVGAVMKISYDVLLWRAFRNIRPREEARSPLSA